MQLDKNMILELLKSKGQHSSADQAATGLPDSVDTDQHADLLSTQSARCMDCGTPFCHQTSSGVACSPSHQPWC